MKVKSILAIALSVLMVGFVSCKKNENNNEPEEITISLDKTALSLEIGASELLTATVIPAGTAVTWTSLHPSIATVTNGLVTAVAEGNTTIIATAGSARALCSVQVGKGEQGKTTYTLKEASAYYPIFVDEVTLGKMEGKIAIDFTVNDEDKHFYPWVVEGTETLTYEFVTASGKNFYETDEGGYMALVCGSYGWAGGGYTATAANIQTLVDAINAEPDKFFFHLGLRSTDNYGNMFYFFGQQNAAHFIIGAGSIYGGTYIYGDYTRDGYWYEFDIPMSQFATALSGLTVQPDATGAAYILSFLTQGIAGAQLNYDALYFYKK